MTQDIEAPVSRGHHHPHPTQESRRSSSLKTDDGSVYAALPHPPAAPTSRGLEEAPKSLSARVILPLTNKNTAANKEPPRLLHPILLKLPLQVRFGCNGIIANVLFMVAYNFAVSFFSQTPASTIYSVTYLIFIPLGHALAALLVFGWPERYIPSLMSNFPIGLTAIAIGGLLTAYLDKIEFEERIEDFIRDNYTFSTMPERPGDKKSEFYASLVVLVVTSIWTYVLSVYINSQPTKSEKKEL